MMSFEPASAASVLSAPVRWPVCSGVTSVIDVQSARLALTATGASRLVTVARNASSLLLGGRLAGDFLEGLAGLAVGRPGARRRWSWSRLRGRLRSEAGGDDRRADPGDDPGNLGEGPSNRSTHAWNVPQGIGHRQSGGCVVTERPRMRRISFRLRSVLVACFFAGLAGIACTQGLGGRCVQDSDCSSGMCSASGETTEGGRCVAPGSTITPPATGGTAGSGAAGDGGAMARRGRVARPAEWVARAVRRVRPEWAAQPVRTRAAATGGNGGSTAGVAGSGGHDGGAADH